MKFVTFEHNGQTRIGLMLGDSSIIDLSKADPTLPVDMLSFLRGFPATFETARKFSTRDDLALPLSQVKLKAPIQGMEKVIGIGLNYRDHAIESGMAIPTTPVFFTKFPSCVIGPNDTILIPPESKEVDYEVELVIVIGKEGKRISEDKAHEYIAGYTVGHDVSARDWQLRRPGGQWDAGKAWDTFAPIGPCIATPDEFNLESGRIQCVLNGEVVQNSTLDQLIFKPHQIVSFMSTLCALKPGDIIFTGTPYGVGFARKPPVFLKSGDRVECIVEGIGSLMNTVDDEKV